MRTRPAALLALALTLGGCPSSANPGRSPSPAPSSPSPALSFPIPEGTYEMNDPVTAEELAACGVKGEQVHENLGTYTLELGAGHWTWTQHPPEPTEAPLWKGDYTATEAQVTMVVTYPGFFQGQTWQFGWTATADGGLAFDHARVENNPEAANALKCDFTKAPWTRAA